MKKTLHFTLSSSDSISMGKQDSLYEVLFAGLRSLGHIPQDCDAVTMRLAFSETGAEGCKPRAILNPLEIEVELPISRAVPRTYPGPKD